MKYYFKKKFLTLFICCNVCMFCGFLFNKTINIPVCNQFYNYKTMGFAAINNLNYDFDYYEEMGDKLYIDNLENTASQKLNKQLTQNDGSQLEKIGELKQTDSKVSELDKNIAEKSVNNNDTIPSRNYTVVIDPGHGGIDPGSIGYKTKVHEADLNLKMSLKLKKKLEDACIKVVLTRETEEGLAKDIIKGFKKKDMALRKELIKKVRPNMVISLHQNSFTNHSLRGAQVFYDKTSEISKQIASYIQEEFISGLEHSNKTTSPGDYFMLKCTSAPSVIVECGFISNAEEEQLLLTDEYQDKVLDCIFKGIVKFLQIH